jgi:ribosomal-protein-alanine N-acetyltransferase
MTPYGPLPETQPTLDAGSCVLRPMTLGDAADWLQYLSDPEVIEWTTIDPMTLPQVEGMIGWYAERFRAREALRWAIVPKGGGAMIGDLGFNVFDERTRRGEIGYVLAKEHWGRGVMTAAVGSALDCGFRAWGLQKVEATVVVGNERSAGLLRKLGFALEGTVRANRNRRGTISDSWLFGLLAGEWRPS